MTGSAVAAYSIKIKDDINRMAFLCLILSALLLFPSITFSEHTSIRITNPKNGHIYPGSLTAKVRHNQPAGKIKAVQYFMDSRLSATVRKAPFSKLLKELPSGEHTVYAVLVNKNGKRFKSKKITFTVISLENPGAGPVNNGSLSGRRPFPDDNPWNKDISSEPVDPDSSRLIASIGASTGLHPDFGTVWEGAPNGIPYVLVSGAQPKIKISSFWYPEESDQVGYPIPDNPPIEGGPDGDGDRHIIMVDSDNWLLYELYAAQKDGKGGWEAGSGAMFDLNSNDLRPAGWTSADAAGLPIFPGLVRYDEVKERGEIRHALRFTVSRSRKGYVHPARHFAGSSTDSSLPPMGMRVRLKADFDISTFPETVQVILRALKKYGMIVADNGSNWFISGAPDPRWDDEELSTIRRVKGSDFEVVRMGEVITE